MQHNYFVFFTCSVRCTLPTPTALSALRFTITHNETPQERLNPLYRELPEIIVVVHWHLNVSIARAASKAAIYEWVFPHEPVAALIGRAIDCHVTPVPPSSHNYNTVRRATVGLSIRHNVKSINRLAYGPNPVSVFYRPSQRFLFRCETKRMIFSSAHSDRITGKFGMTIPLSTN